MIIILEKFKRWSLLYGRNGFSQCHQFVCKLVKDGGLEIYMSANPAINLLSYRLRSGCPRLRYITFHMERGERLRPNESFIYANTNNPLDGQPTFSEPLNRPFAAHILWQKTHT